LKLGLLVPDTDRDQDSCLASVGQMQNDGQQQVGRKKNLTRLTNLFVLFIVKIVFRVYSKLQCNIFSQKH